MMLEAYLQFEEPMEGLRMDFEVIEKGPVAVVEAVLWRRGYTPIRSVREGKAWNVGIAGIPRHRAKRICSMRGTITRRGKHSWRLKFDLDRDHGVGRQTRYITVRGTRREAEAELAKLLTAADGGMLIEPSKITVAEFVRERVDPWEAAGDISARTAAALSRNSSRTRSRRTSARKPLQKLTPAGYRGVAHDVAHRWPMRR